jgi:DNA gyrase subunit A
MFITRSGMIVRSPAVDLRPMGRNTQGVRLVNIKADDAIVAAEIVHADDIGEEDEAFAEGAETAETGVSAESVDPVDADGSSADDSGDAGDDA